MSFDAILQHLHSDSQSRRRTAPDAPQGPPAELPAFADIPEPDWTLANLVRREQPRLDLSSGLWPHCYAEPDRDLRQCPICGGIGDVIVQQGIYSKSIPCTCKDLSRLVDNYNRIGLPVGFADVSVEGTDWTFKQAAKVAPEVRRLVGDEQADQPLEPDVNGLVQSALGWAPGMPGFLLYGNNGSGKTRAAALVCTMLATRRPRVYEYGKKARRPVVRAVEWPMLLQRIKAGFDSGKSEPEIVAPYLNSDVLWVDEVGMGRRTEWVNRVAEDLFWARLNSGRTTLMTSNLPLDERHAFQGWDRKLGTIADRLGSRVMSRLQRQVNVIEMVGEDYRGRLGWPRQRLMRKRCEPASGVS